MKSLKPDCRNDSRSHPELGYSIIEIVVSLAILALAATIAFPGAIGMVEQFEREARFRTILQEIESLRGQAVASGHLIILDSASSARPANISTLPSGWRLQTNGPLIFSPAAVCSGQGVVIISASEQRRYFSLDTERCAFDGPSVRTCQDC